MGCRPRVSDQAYAFHTRLSARRHINAELNAVLNTPETRERLGAQGIQPRGGTSAEFNKYLRSEIPKWTKVVKDSGAKAD